MAPMDSPLLGSVVAGCLLEIKTGGGLLGYGGGGVSKIFPDNSRTPVTPSALSQKTDISRMFWSTEMCGRPAKATDVMLGNLTNTSSFAGACFVFNSASYSISRVILGQLDAYVDFYAGLVTQPGGDKWERLSTSLFQGKVFGLFPYDVAAAAFLAKEAGATVTDAFGHSLENVELLKSGRDGLMTAVVAANPALSRQILTYLENGFRQANT
jgi:myo-inositol-1(or 4)-monophosphatase